MVDKFLVIVLHPLCNGPVVYDCLFFVVYMQIKPKRHVSLLCLQHKVFFVRQVNAFPCF